MTFVLYQSDLQTDKSEHCATDIECYICIISYVMRNHFEQVNVYSEIETNVFY